MVRNKVGKKVGNKKAFKKVKNYFLGMSETSVEKNISFLKENGYIKRVGQRRRSIGECCKKILAIKIFAL